MRSSVDFFNSYNCEKNYGALIRKNLEYEFHDSVVVGCTVEKADRISLVVELYSIYYPTQDLIRLTFSGIYNSEATINFVNRLIERANVRNCIAERIDSLHFDKEKISKDLDLYVVLDFDHYQPFTVHCKKLRIVKVEEIL